jgi:hypothetical protein
LTSRNRPDLLIPLAHVLVGQDTAAMPLRKTREQREAQRAEIDRQDREYAQSGSLCERHLVLRGHQDVRMSLLWITDEAYYLITIRPGANVSNVRQEPCLLAFPFTFAKDHMIPFFDSDDRSHKERLEATRMAVNLVSEFPETIDALLYLMRRVRNLAAARVACTPSEIPEGSWKALFVAHDGFVIATRKELGLSNRPEVSKPALLPWNNYRLTISLARLCVRSLLQRFHTGQ